MNKKNRIKAILRQITDSEIGKYFHHNTCMQYIFVILLMNYVVQNITSIVMCSIPKQRILSRFSKAPNGFYTNAKK